MTAHHDDDLMAEIRAALDVEPPPGFTTRLRTRLEETSSHRGVWGWQWRRLGVAAGVVLVMGVFGWWSWPDRDRQDLASGTATHADILLDRAAAGVRPAIESSPPLTVESRPPMPIREPVVHASIAEAVTEPEIVLDARQTVLLQALLDRVRAGDLILPGEPGMPSADKPVVIQPLPLLEAVRISEVTIEPLPNMAGS